MKSNPLFHDSTVTQGANIQTQFEISNVELRDREVLCLKLVVEGEVRCLEMTPKSEKVYQTSTWIQHRQKITYQFFIQRGGELLYATAPKKTLALHTVIEKWAPLEGTDWKSSFQNIPELTNTKGLDFVENEPVAKNTDTYLDNLIDKWDL